MPNNENDKETKVLLDRHVGRLKDASKEGRLYSISSPHMLTIESDRLHRVLLDYKHTLADKRAWIQSFVSAASLLTGYLSIDTFKIGLLNSGEWRGLFIALIAIMIYLTGRDIIRSIRAKTPTK